MKKILLTLAAAAAVFSGCNKTAVETSGRGGLLQLNVACDEAEFTEKEHGQAGTKASAAPDVNDFIVTLVKSSGSYSLVCTVSEFMEQNTDGIITLSPGSYTISVTSAGDEKAAWDQPVYGVTKEFTIVEDVVTPVDLVCGLTNMKVTVKLSDVFISELESWSVVVTGSYDDGDASLTWSSDDGDRETVEAKEGWFAVGPLTVVVQGVRTVDGSDAVRVTEEITDVAAADHHILNINARVTGDGDFSEGGITVDPGVNDKPVDIEIPGFDETPIEDPDDPDEPVIAAPSMTWPTNPKFETRDIVDGLDVTLNISAPGKIETFVVHVSENFQPLVSMITTGGVPYLDLINDQAVIDMLKEAIPALADGLYGQTDVTFSLSSLIQLIRTVGTPGQDYVFTLSLTDQLGQELPEQPLTFHLPETASSAE